MAARRISSVIIDLSGTLHIEDLAIKGAQSALQRLRSSGVRVKFVTNSTKDCKRVLHDKMNKLGFDIDRSELFTTLTAARQLVEAKGLRPLLYLEDSAREDFEGVNVENPNAVVIGLAPNCFDYVPMNEAFRLLLDGAHLIAVHKSRYFRRKDGLYLGVGAFVSGLEYATDTEAEVIGKPAKAFFQEAIRDMGSGPENTVMIGDDVRDDVLGAMELGMMGILVKTGKYLEGDEDKISPQPTAVCQDFPDAVEFILKHVDK